MIEKIIPNKYIKEIKNGTFSPNKFQAAIEKKLFIKRIKKFFNETFEIDTDKLYSDLNELENNSILNVSKYDKECTLYGIQVLNFKEIKNIIENLYYNKCFMMCYITDALNIFLNKYSKESQVYYINQNIELVKEINFRLRLICPRKSMKDFYKEQQKQIQVELAILKKYLSILALC